MNLEQMFGDEPEQGAVLIDLSQIALATAAVTMEPGEKFTIPLVRQMILATLRKNALKFKAEGYTKVVVAIDNARYGYWRRQVEDYYKRNRAIAREEAEEANQFDWEGYFEGLGVVIQELKDYMPYTVIDVRHCEADDVIAVLSQYMSSIGWKVRIISSDGDFTQLHKLKNVDQYSPMQKKFVKVKTGSPEEDCLTKVMKGDRKDCVASIKVRGDFWLNYNVGVERTPQTSPKFVTELVGKSDEEIYQMFYDEIFKKLSHKKAGPDHAAKFLSLQGKEFEPGDFDPNLTSKLIAELWMDRFRRNRVLIDFDHIREDIREAILEEYRTFTPAPRGKMYSYFVKSKLTKLIPHINNF
ncbi:rnh RNaseH ribonuclease [Acinetobacter phage Acj9]|uniref:Rnh RNaseH ribonuclease n=1 Tax=Acinetobacter phage Acj9 TaxID=760939 RepID=E5EQ24_9CAUD|nr:rnh RNaseH ribonuclease [Acinetobacter phage Acj9]ADG60140.1 rnh RNaseH ribonuclease [Acinetobacter phage Acj9]